MSNYSHYTWVEFAGYLRILKKDVNTGDTIKGFHAGISTIHNIADVGRIVDDLNENPRANVEQRDDGLYICWGDHDKSTSCNYEIAISYDLEHKIDQITKDLTTPAGQGHANNSILSEASTIHWATKEKEEPELQMGWAIMRQFDKTLSIEHVKSDGTKVHVEIKLNDVKAGMVFEGNGIQLKITN